jgi:hypothetical protein
MEPVSAAPRGPNNEGRCSTLAANINPLERSILGELGVLSERLRALRAAKPPNVDDIRPVEAQMSLRWQELRLLRAGPVNAEAHVPQRRSKRS